MCSPNPGKILIAALLCFLSSASAVQAADDVRYLYQWKDDRGVVNMTDSLEKVPPKFRSRATRMQQPGAGNKDEEGREDPGVRYRSPVPGAGTSMDQDEIGKAEWQRRMQSARISLAEAEERLARAEQEIKTLQEKHGFGLYGYTPEAQDELDQLNLEVQTALKDREDARNMIENVLPEEARKAGVPPGWLREVQ